MDVRAAPRLQEYLLTAGVRGFQTDVNVGSVEEGLVDDAVSLRELEQSIELVSRRTRLNIETQSDCGETDGHLLADSHGSPEVQVTLDVNGASLDRYLHRRRH
jgi:hypothetical protein